MENIWERLISKETYILVTLCYHYNLHLYGNPEADINTLKKRKKVEPPFAADLKIFAKNKREVDRLTFTIQIFSNYI